MFARMTTVVDCLFHKGTNTCTYVVRGENSRKCAVIDSVMDFSYPDGKYWFEHNAKVINLINEKNLELEWILETHVHADHLTGAQHLKQQFPHAKTAIGEHIKEVQAYWKGVFNLGNEFTPDGSQWDHLFKEGEEFAVGDLTAKVIHTPGHTSDSVSYLIGDSLFSGDTLFMPDGGSARCDFPKGSASLLFQSVAKQYALPDSTRMFVGHDYAPGGRDFKWETTIGEQKEKSIHLKSGVTAADYIKMREERDKTLNSPALLLPSIQFNIRAGKFPPPASNGVSYLVIPLSQKL